MSGRFGATGGLARLDLPSSTWVVLVVLSISVPFLPAACGRGSGIHDLDAASGIDRVEDSALDDGGATGPDGASDGGAPPVRGLGIMTWNLEQFPKSAGTIAMASQIITTQAVDLVGIQEVGDTEDLALLAASLPEHQGICADDPGNYTRVCLLYRSARLTPSEVETLFDDDSYAFPRPPLKARMELADTHGNVIFDFVFMVVHLKAQIDAASQQRRRAACQALHDYIADQQAAGPEQDFIVVGDYNDELTDSASDNVFQVFLDRPQSYTFLTMDAAVAGEYSYITFSAMIDHVLVTSDVLGEYGNGATLVIPLDETIPTYEEEISDHRPVVSWFALP